MKTIYLIRHSKVGVNIDNYIDYKTVLWEEYNTNMVLSVEGEKCAEKLCDVEELQNIDQLYASSSPRAIATAKYISEKINLPIKLDNRINERDFGVEYISELPDDFNYQMFNDKSWRFKNGETLEELDTRITDFINEKLDGDSNKIAIVLHGIILLSYLGSIAEETFDGKDFNITFNGKEILNGTPSAPDIYKITFDNKKVVDIKRIRLGDGSNMNKEIITELINKIEKLPNETETTTIELMKEIGKKVSDFSNNDLFEIDKRLSNDRI